MNIGVKMEETRKWIGTDSSRGLALIGLPFSFSLFLLAAPLLLIFFLGFWTQDYLIPVSYTHLTLPTTPYV